VSNDDEDDETDYREVGDAFAEKAEGATSRLNEADQLAGVTYALLAIYHELRHNDLGSKIDTLTDRLMFWQEERDRTESRIASAVDDVKDAVASRSRWSGR
jgi:hypothetical protein